MPRTVTHAICRPWPGHRRSPDALTPEALGPLMQALLRDGGQKTPAIVRCLPQTQTPIHGKTFVFEVISGLRRFYAIKLLSFAGHTLPFLIEPTDMSDADAFALVDAENRNRENLSVYDRGCAYAEALGAHFNGDRAAMATRLGVSQTTLSRYLTCAQLPAGLLQAYPNPTRITVKHVEKLARALHNPTACARMEHEACRIVLSNATPPAQQGAQNPQTTPDEITRRLLAAAYPKPPKMPPPPLASHTVTHKSFGTLAHGHFTQNGGIDIHIERPQIARLHHVLCAIAEILGTLAMHKPKTLLQHIKTLKTQGLNAANSTT